MDCLLPGRTSSVTVSFPYEQGYREVGMDWEAVTHSTLFLTLSGMNLCFVRRKY
jgi:hypothetical protein